MSHNPVFELVETHRHELLDFVRRRVPRNLLLFESIEDLVQGVCTHALERSETFQARDSPSDRAWLFELSRNFLIDRQRYWQALKRSGGRLLRAMEGPQNQTEWDPIRDLAASVTGPSTFASRREQLRLAAQALSLLLDSDRALVASLVHGESIAELSERLGVSPAAAQRARHRALERFRGTFALVSGQRP